jgi:hypothetical protein
MKYRWLYLTARLMRLFHRPKVHSRHNNPFPRRCRECGWVARERDWRHWYAPDGTGNVEAVDYCRNCGKAED